MFNKWNLLIFLLLSIIINLNIICKSIEQKSSKTIHNNNNNTAGCHGCDNGKCLSNNNNNTFECICNLGFYWNHHLAMCIPYCNNKNKTNNSTTSSIDEMTGFDDDDDNDCPQNNQCLNGYKLKNVTTEDGKPPSTILECQPICNPMCINGKCIEPNVCHCNTGYWVQNALYHHICIPFCSDSCINGNCSAPNTCTCNEGFVYKNDSNGLCESLCQVECKNGFCLDPLLCECNDGYYKNHKNQCEPMCKESCINSICTKPNHCTCHQGYELNIELPNNSGICEKIVCDPPCQNGLCISKNVCNCFNGYQLNERSLLTDHHWYLCEPICKDDNTDDDDDDYDDDVDNEYINVDNLKDIASSSSVDGCINGTCIAPNQCQCFDGFELSVYRNLTCILKIDNDIKLDQKKSSSVYHVFMEDNSMSSCKWSKILSYIFEGLFAGLIVFILIFIYIRRKMQSGTYNPKEPNINNVEIIMDKWSND